ncbi:arylsulfatase [Flammeovirga sp. EKP202]|uniref:arylsulfatase n=1 Tax=Flammeovirga sp. EKP202 TaxID=2770592 RepID=UPI00165FCE8A|nr:arylsulfatase [Flammeovirga sp. EKP202]MBD0404597.1 arylsulfatase [Flammeovirga sp. EKP202]
MKKNIYSFLCLFFTVFGLNAQSQKPNVLVIMGDDVGYDNISRYNLGQFSYTTPNIDQIGVDGVTMTTSYAQQTCTAGRAAFITGQSPLRTGLTTIGMPGSKIGLQKEDPTIAEILKPLGYRTGQFGKNHLGDKDDFLPTNHGFDEFYGNLYHLNAEEEPEDPAYPQDPEFRKKYAPRGVIHSYADGRISDTGPLTAKRMETVDQEFLDASMKFMDTAIDNDEPFFVWFNSTRMHVWTHLEGGEKNEDLQKYGIYGAGMKELDNQVGELLDFLEKKGVSDNTIVIFTTDNGVEKMTWPDGGNSRFRGEKGSTWEGGVRVPFLIKYPNGIKNTGKYLNGMIAHEDVMPTLYRAITGKGDLAEQLKTTGYQGLDRNYKVHLDGYDQWDYITGKQDESNRKINIYVADNGDIQAVRWNDWKVHFIIQEGEGEDGIMGPRTVLNWPRIYNLAQDPYEVGDESGLYLKWMGQKMWLFVPIKEILGEFVGTFQEFPPRQKPETLSPTNLKKLIYSKTK